MGKLFPKLISHIVPVLLLVGPVFADVGDDVSGKQQSFQTVAKGVNSVTQFGTGKLHTIFLLGVMGASQNLVDNLRYYHQTGDLDAYERAKKQSLQILKETGVSSSLWLQMVGAGTIHVGASSGQWALEKGLSLRGVERSLAPGILVHHLIGYGSFFGWEFGAALHAATTKHMAETLPQDSNPYNEYDLVRISSIKNILLDPNTRESYFNSMIHVLKNDKSLGTVFDMALAPWLGFNLLSDYAALAIGGRMGQMAMARLGGLVGAQIGPVGATIGSFVGVVAFMLVKGTYFHHFFNGLDESYVRTPFKNNAENNSLFALNMFDPIGFASWLRGRPASQTNAQAALERHRSTRQSALKEHLMLVGRPLVEISPLIQRYFQTSYAEELRLRILTGEFNSRGERRVAAYQSQLKHVLFVFSQIKQLKNTLAKIRKIPSSQWTRRRAEFAPSDESNLSGYTKERAIAVYEIKIDQLMNQNPILNTSITRTVTRKVGLRSSKRVTTKTLFEWLSNTSSTDNKYQLIIDGAQALRTYLAQTKEKVELMTDEILTTDSSMASPDWFAQRGRRHDEVLEGHLAENTYAVKNRLQDLKNYLNSIYHRVTQVLQNAPFAWIKGDSTSLQEDLSREAVRVQKLRVAFGDVFDLSEESYMLMDAKLSLMTNWFMGDFDEEDFLKQVEELQKIKPMIVANKRVHVHRIAIQILEAEYMAIQIKKAVASGGSSLNLNPEDMQKYVATHVGTLLQQMI